MYYVYIIVSEKDGSLYTGQTRDLSNRVERHNKGLIPSTKGKAPYRLGYYESFGTRAEAMWREWELKKKWNTERKKKLIAEFDQSKLAEFPGL